MSKVLQIENLHVAIGGKEILKGLDLTVRQGERVARAEPLRDPSRHSPPSTLRAMSSWTSNTSAGSRLRSAGFFSACSRFSSPDA